MEQKPNMKPYIPSLSEKEYKSFLERLDIEEISKEQTGQYVLTRNYTRVIPVACMAKFILELQSTITAQEDIVKRLKEDAERLAHNLLLAYALVWPDEKDETISQHTQLMNELGTKYG